ncbi:unnamed protein product [marine sediment metagenome]|uniref:Uncharacterized protein n=1 Tax=marine sediment metagenome TaxID=412755 RepID=X1NFL3_9ZZZZ
MPEVNLPRAIEILTTEKNTAKLQSDPAFYEALTIALICMSYCDAMIKALGEAEIAKLTKGD